jgi:hypothetical protein
MCEHTIENDVARWEMRQLERKAARLCRVKHLRNGGIKQLFAKLTALGSRVLLNLGNALIAAGEKLRVTETSSKAASASL